MPQIWSAIYQFSDSFYDRVGLQEHSILNVRVGQVFVICVNNLEDELPPKFILKQRLAILRKFLLGKDKYLGSISLHNLLDEGFKPSFELLLDLQEGVVFELMLANARYLAFKPSPDHPDCFLVLGQESTIIEPVVNEVLANLVLHDDVVFQFDFAARDDGLKELCVCVLAINEGG